MYVRTIQVSMGKGGKQNISKTVRRRALKFGYLVCYPGMVQERDCNNLVKIGQSLIQISTIVNDALLKKIHFLIGTLSIWFLITQGVNFPPNLPPTPRRRWLKTRFSHFFFQYIFCKCNRKSYNVHTRFFSISIQCELHHAYSCLSLGKRVWVRSIVHRTTSLSNNKPLPFFLTY
jgi:hypothetical protein